jgi:hypothetical protein
MMTDNVDQRCRYFLSFVPSTHRKDGAPRKTNRFATECSECGDQLQPGEAAAGRLVEGKLRWVCGAGRWRRP